MKKFNIKKNSKNNKGVSLIELMLAIALIGILTSIIVTTARFSETQKNLNLARGELQAVLRLAQSYSLSIPNTGHNNICGFGVEVDGAGKQYNIFYTYEDSDTCDSDPLIASSREIRDVVKIKADEITVTGPNPDVFFRAPYGDVFNGGTFNLSSTKVANPMNVTVSSLGQIN